MTATTVESVGSKGTVKIMANIFISFLGAGILGLPYAFMEAGILEGILIMLFVGICSVKAMLLVIDCKHRLIAKTPRKQPASNGTSNSSKYEVGNKLEKEDLLLGEGETGVTIEDPTMPAAPGQNLTYGDVGYYAIGNLGRVIVDIVIVVSQVGFCCAYLIFICENLADYIGGLRLVYWLFIVLPPLFGLTLIRHLSSLALSSLFAQLSNLMAFAVVFWFDFEHFTQVKSIHPKEISLKGFPFFLAIAIYCYEGAGMILSLEGSLHKDVRHQFKGYFKLTMAIVTFLYISFGVCGYLSFGPETNAIITLNLPKGSDLDFSMVVKSCLCLSLFFTYPVMMFPVVNIIETKVIQNAQENPRRGNILRFFMVFLTGLIVLAVPNFANLMALVGATCCTMIAFVLPAIFHMKLFKGNLTKWEFSVDVFLIVLGISGAIVGTMDALVRLGETHNKVKPTTVVHPIGVTSPSMPVSPTILNMTSPEAEKWISKLPSQLPVQTVTKQAIAPQIYAGTLEVTSVKPDLVTDRFTSNVNSISKGLGSQSSLKAITDKSRLEATTDKPYTWKEAPHKNTLPNTSEQTSGVLSDQSLLDEVMALPDRVENPKRHLRHRNPGN